MVLALVVPGWGRTAVRGAGTGRTGPWRHTVGLVRGAGTGGTRLVIRTSGQVRGAGTGRTGLWGRTGGLECRADTTSPGWMFILALQLAQDALGCADSPETQYAEPAQDILGQGGTLETTSAEPAPSFLAGCSF